MRAEKRVWEDDELVAEWTLEPSDQTLLANKAGPTRFGFAALLAFFRAEGPFPTSKHEVPPAIVKHLASQVGVPADAYSHVTPLMYPHIVGEDDPRPLQLLLHLEPAR